MTAIELRPEGSAQSARLFEAHAPRLLAYCQRRLGTRAEAEDAVQTVFLYAHRALGRGVVPRSEEAWLLTIAKNVCRWQRRTASRRGALVHEVDMDALPSHRGDDEAEEIQRDLEEALAGVPERQREALLLREWRGLSCPEIAEALDLSEPATHALLTRARRSVARALTAAGRRPVLGLDLPGLLSQLRAVFAGTAAKSAATVVAAAGLGLGGVAVERAIGTSSTPRLASEAPVTRPASATANPGHRTARLQADVAGKAGSSIASEQSRARGPQLPSADAQPRASDASPPRSDVFTRAAAPDAGQPSDAGPPTAQPPLPVNVPPPPTVDPPGLDVPTVPSLPDPTTPEAEVPPVTVGDVTTPGVTVPGVTVPASDVTDPVKNLLP